MFSITRIILNWFYFVDLPLIAKFCRVIQLLIDLNMEKVRPKKWDINK